MQVQTTPFHLAFPILSIEETRHFYQTILGCEIGRESDRWIDFNFFGHQLSGHVVDVMPQIPSNKVDDKDVPVAHFGAIINRELWDELHKKLSALHINFLIKPYLRWEGQIGEQGTFFIQDPSGNGIEFKTFKSPDLIFQK